MTKPSEMPGWPDDLPTMGDLLRHGLNNIQPAQFELDCRLKHNELMISYERARADAWEARCRAAVEALVTLRLHTYYGGDGCGTVGGSHDYVEGRLEQATQAATFAGRALSTIGPLPPLPPQQQRTGE